MGSFCLSYWFFDLCATFRISLSLSDEEHDIRATVGPTLPGYDLFSTFGNVAATPPVNWYF